MVNTEPCSAVYFVVKKTRTNCLDACVMQSLIIYADVCIYIFIYIYYDVYTEVRLLYDCIQNKDWFSTISSWYLIIFLIGKNYLQNMHTSAWGSSYSTTLIWH